VITVSIGLEIKGGTTPLYSTYQLCSCLLSFCRTVLQSAQPRGQRAAPDPDAAAGQPHDCRACSSSAPAVESGPGYPQLGDHLVDRQQRVIRGAGAFGRGGGGPAGSGVRSRGGPSVGPGRRTLRSGRPVKSGPRPAGHGSRPPGAADQGRGNKRKGRTGCPTRACLNAGSALRCQRGPSWAGWPRVPPHYPLTKKSGFQGLYHAVPENRFGPDRDTGHGVPRGEPTEPADADAGAR
jgi:hypothetical protein